MRPLVYFTALVFVLGATSPETSAAAEAGYPRLRMVEIEDPQDSERPVGALRFLAAADGRIEGLRALARGA
jgi:hypothetical protein